MSFLILEKARREDEPLRLSPQLKESMIASSKRNIKDLEEAKGKIADAISAAIKEVEDKIKAQKKENTQAKKEGKEEDIREDVNVLQRFFDLDASKKEIQEEAEEYVVENLPRNARDLIMPELYETTKKTIGGYTVKDTKRTGAKIEDVIDSIIEGEKKDIARYEGAEEAETEEIKEVVQEIGREKPRAKMINDFLNEKVEDKKKQFKFDYVKLLKILEDLAKKGYEAMSQSLGDKPITSEMLAEQLSPELEEGVILAVNILSRMASRDVDSLRNLRKALISVSRAMKKDKREGVDDLEEQISAITERLEEFPTPSGPEITPKTLNKLKSIKKMLEVLEKKKDEDLMVIEVLGRGNPAKNTFTELKNIAKNPQRIFYLGVPKSEDFLAPLGVMQKMTKGNRYNRPKESGKSMERYKELGKLGQDIHDLLNEPVDKKAFAATEAMEIEEGDKEMLAELERSKRENSLLHLLRQVYRSMTGQILDIGAEKALQRKFKEERAKRIKRIKESRSVGFDAERAVAEKDRRSIPEGMTRLIDAKTGESRIVTEEEAERIEQERAKDFISVEEMRERRK